jgi:preprotein translocase subunit SecE
VGAQRDFERVKIPLCGGADRLYKPLRQWRATIRSRAAIVSGSRNFAVGNWMPRTGPAGRYKMANPFEFLQQVRAEGSKITWPTRRETMITTGLVVLMVFVASLFFIAVDQTIRIAVRFIMSIGH